MGRPVNKKYFGITSTGASAGNNITVNCKVGSNAAVEQGIILSQRASNKFKVNDAKDGSGNTGICTLVNKVPGSLAADEMSIVGFANGATAVFIKRLYNRTAHGFDGARYSWSVVDDSTANYIQLTAI
jgi:hypothetical protein